MKIELGHLKVTKSYHWNDTSNTKIERKVTDERHGKTQAKESKTLRSTEENGIEDSHCSKSHLIQEFAVAYTTSNCN